MSNRIGGLTADELEERMTEAEFRERLDLMGRSPPDAAAKLDVVIALLRAIYIANVSLAGSWVKGFEPPDPAKLAPTWGRRKRKAMEIMPAQEVLAIVRAAKGA